MGSLLHFLNNGAPLPRARRARAPLLFHMLVLKKPKTVKITSFKSFLYCLIRATVLL